MRINGFIIASCCAALCCWNAGAADLSPVGKWKTFEEGTGRPKSIVQIYDQNGAVFGKVEQGLIPERAGRKCDKCSDDRKGQPIVGMVIIRGLKAKGDEYAGGDILDPENGSVYSCKLKVVENGKKLSVRGFKGVSMLGRSQVWERVE
jgi:uncharacterized protein (DUF2147 family)